MRKHLFLGVGLVGAAMLFLAIAKRLRGSMLPPCPTCGRRDTLAKVASTGFPMGDALLWLCSCGDTRDFLINDDVPRTNRRELERLGRNIFGAKETGWAFRGGKLN